MDKAVDALSAFGQQAAARVDQRNEAIHGFSRLAFVFQHCLERSRQLAVQVTQFNLPRTLFHHPQRHRLKQTPPVTRVQFQPLGLCGEF